MFAAAIGNYVILIGSVFALLAVELRSRFLRLFCHLFCESGIYSARRYELGSYVNAITRTGFLYGLDDISVVCESIVLYGMFLRSIERILDRFFAFPSYVRRREAIFTRATYRVVRVRMDLGITDRGIQDICRMDEAS